MTIFIFAAFLFSVALMDHSLILSVLYLVAMWSMGINLMLPDRFKRKKEVSR